MGLDGKPFLIYKFRSMYEDAERETGPVWAVSDDPRRTPVGRIMRRFSIDELPQLLNVLKGDMSLVGPRPERPSFVKEFKQRIPQYMLRHKVKCGMTGWAQVNGWRGNTSIEKRIEHDLYYIQNWSLSLDVKILAHVARRPPQARVKRPAMSATPLHSKRARIPPAKSECISAGGRPPAQRAGRAHEERGEH
jgi:lipopolysaccharide/colanic/teichoic acid biosynthesis glycosyltransferase